MCSGSGFHRARPVQRCKEAAARVSATRSRSSRACGERPVRTLAVAGLHMVIHDERTTKVRLFARRHAAHRRDWQR